MIDTPYVRHLVFNCPKIENDETISFKGCAHCDYFIGVWTEDDDTTRIDCKLMNDIKIQRMIA